MGVRPATTVATSYLTVRNVLATIRADRLCTRLSSRRLLCTLVASHHTGAAYRRMDVDTLARVRRLTLDGPPWFRSRYPKARLIFVAFSVTALTWKFHDKWSSTCTPR